MLTLAISVGAALFLSFSNGANDNFKGVATLLGSKTSSYKVALIWATVTTLAGSLTAFYLAQELMTNFSGKGLVPDDVGQLSTFSISVAMASGLTVFLATKLGFPISTTHAIVGALVGTGLLASPLGVNFEKLTTTFLSPLILSPVISILATIALYSVFSLGRKYFGIRRESCLCIGNQVLQVAPVGVKNGSFQGAVTVDCGPQITLGTKVTCEERYTGNVWGISAKSLLDSGHFLSSGLVGFARGLNDTPKIAAILIAGSALPTLPSIGVVAGVMALGGVLFARKIADTMSYQITSMNDGQGFTANLVTSLVVIVASRFGMPVSTTHVSCGALFGIGMVTRKAHGHAILKIVMSWITTLPLAALLGYLSFALMQTL